MDAKSQHNRFRQLVQAVVEDRLEYHPSYAEKDWLCRSYQSLSVFLEHFPNPEQREELIHQLESDLAPPSEIAAELDRMNREGLTYTDLEELEYEFPRIQEDDSEDPEQ